MSNMFNNVQQTFFSSDCYNENLPAGQTEVTGSNIRVSGNSTKVAPGKYVIVGSALNAGVKNNIVVRV